MHIKTISSAFFLALLFLLCKPCYSQSYYVVKGKVIDKTTKAPLQGASVFAQNTTFGEATNTEGNFTLKVPDGGYLFVVTYTGYETGTEHINKASSQNDSLVIELTPKIKSMEDVSIVVSSEVKDGWQKYGRFFTDNFIGQSQYAKQCSIKNPEVLHFYFSKKRNRLKVLATEPLVVVNPALGYNLKFAIDSFTNEYTSNTILFVGYPLFEEMSGNAEQQQVWKQNRAEAYKGSMLQLMRSLFTKTLEKNGFELQFIVKTDDSETSIPLQNLYGALNYDKDDSTNTVEFRPNQNEMAVIYKNAKPESTYLITDSSLKRNFELSTLQFSPGESIVIEQNGYYYDQTDITTNGYLAFKKIGDMLPYDYVDQ